MLVRVSDKGLVLPTGTFEKSRLESLVLNSPPIAAPEDNGMTRLLLEASLTRERLAFTAALDGW